MCNLGGKFGDDVRFGEILIVDDEDGDGVADTAKVFASGLDTPTGLAFRGEDLYVSSRGEVAVLRDLDGDDEADVAETIVRLTDYGVNIWSMHINNGIALGPDDMLYITQGSQHNTKPGDSEYWSTIVRCNPDGSNLTIFASGLRNPYDLAFSPSGELFATENGPDGPLEEKEGPYTPGVPDELNHIVQGGHYGFAEYYGEPPAGTGTLGPVATFTPHAGAEGLAFNTGDRFPGYEGDLFVALYHSGKVVAVSLARSDETYAAEVREFIEFPCLPGKTDPKGEGHRPCLHQHPLNVAFGPDGDLFISAFGTISENISISELSVRVRGSIYRLSSVSPDRQTRRR